MPEEHQHNHELNRFWNALSRSAAAPRVSDLDPDDAETLRQLHVMRQAPPPDWVAARVDTAIRERLTIPQNGHKGSGLGQASRLANQPGSNGPTRVLASSVAPGTVRRGWSLVRAAGPYLATVWLLLLTLGVGYLTIHLRSSSDPTDGEQVSAPGAAAIDTVFATTLPAGEISDDVLHFFVWRLAIDPGARTPAAPEGSCCQGPQITHVVSGELTVHVDGPMRVFRASDGVLEGPVTNGEEIVLLAGDTVMHDVSIRSEYANHSATPAQIINTGLVSGRITNRWADTVRYLDGSEEFHQGALPAGPVAIDLVRATLPPDGEFPAPPPGSLVLEVGEAGDASVGKSSKDSLFNINDRAETIYVVIVGPARTLSVMP